MIIPVRCFTCNKVIADKWRAFQAARDKARKSAGRDEDMDKDTDSFFFEDEPSVGNILDDLGVTRICCRRHFLAHVDLIDVI